MSKTSTLLVHHAFLYISLRPLPFLHGYDVKLSNFRFFEGPKNEKAIYFFLNLETLIKIP